MTMWGIVISLCRYNHGIPSELKIVLSSIIMAFLQDRS